MPYVNVRITAGVTTQQKLAVIEGITDVLVEVLGKDPNSTFVVIDEVETDNWGHKRTSVTELRKASGAGAAGKPAQKTASGRAKRSATGGATASSKAAVKATATRPAGGKAPATAGRPPAANAAPVKTAPARRTPAAKTAPAASRASTARKRPGKGA
jgi:4-oxalocrotonate tautomerase